MKLHGNIVRSIPLLAIGALAILTTLQTRAAVWTNFLGNMRWGTAANWSPNTFPNADGAVADFQVDVPAPVTIQNVANGGGNLSATLSILKLGDTAGSEGITINKGGAATSRFHFTNSVGTPRIEKLGDGNDFIDVGSLRAYSSQLDIAFLGGLGTLRIGCDIAQQSPYLTRVNVTGAGTLIFDANSTYAGGLMVDGATIEFSGDQRLGAVPASVEPAAVTIANGGALRADGNTVNISANRGLLLKGSGPVRFMNVEAGKNFFINGPISSDSFDAPSALIVSGPGNIHFTGPNTYTVPTLLTGGTLSIVAANHTGAGDLAISNETMLTLNLTNYGRLDVANATIGDGGNVTVTLNYGDLTGGNPFDPAMNITGAFNPGAANIVLNVSGSGFATGQFPLIDYSGSALGDIANFTLGTLPPGVVGTLVHNAANTSIDLDVSLVVNAVTWYGSVNNQWDIGTTLNWNGGTATYNEYGVAGDAVTFDDTLDATALNYNVDLTTTVKPAVITVANNNADYSISGAGQITGSTILTKTGSQAVTISTANDYAGGSTISLGTVRVGHDTALGMGTVTLNGGTLSSDSTAPRTLPNTLRIPGLSTLGDLVNNGTLTFTDTLDFAGAGRDITLNSDVTFTGTVGNGGLDQKMGPGTLRFNGVLGEFTGGQVQIENGSFIVNGGNLLKTGGGIRVVCMQPGGLSSFDINGGVVTIFTSGGNLRLGSATSPTSDPTATNVVNISGTLTWTTNNSNGGNVQMGSSCALAQLNLNSGGLMRPFVFVHEGGNTELNFDGGTLAPLSSHPNFLQGLTAAYVRSGGAIIDTEGNDIVIGQSLLDGSGNGGLVKNGAGKLTLTGANTYTGDTVVNGGTLIVGPTHFAPGDITIANGAIGGFLSTGVGQTVNVPSTTVASGGSLQVEFTGYTGNPSAAGAHVGTLILNGVTPVNLRAGGLTVGTIPLLTYSSLSGGSFTTGQLPPGVVGTIVHNSGAQTIELVITSITPVLWTGATSSVWDLNLTANWSLDGNPTVFNNGDTVRFDDSAASPFVVVSGTVAPGSITISNTALAYSVTPLSTGKISGATGLIKQGTNNLLIAGAHDFDGEVTISAGTVLAGSSTALGSTNGITTVLNGATLDSGGQDLRNERVVTSGAGYNGKGALISSGALQNSFRHVTLVGDTTLGGVNGIQWGFHSTAAIGATFAANGFKITKVGSGDVLLKDLGETGIGDIEIVESALSFQDSTTMGDPTKTCTVQSAGILAFRDRTVISDKILVINGGMVRDTHATAPSEFMGPTTLNGICQFSITPTLTMSGVINGSGTLLKTGTGTLVLSGANGYTGGTVVSNGTLLITGNGSIAASTNIFINAGAVLDVANISGFTIGAGQTLSGNGTVNGLVNISGQLSPGASVGTLSFNSDLVAEGTTLMEVTADGGLVSDSVQVAGSLTVGGTLQVVLLGSTPLAVNDTFDLFNWGAFSGSFSSVILPAGYTWDTSQLTVDGTIRVAAVSAAPSFDPPVYDGSNLTLSGSGGAPGGTYHVLSSTEVNLPIASWTPVATNSFDGGGNFSFTIPVSTATPRSFYLISIP